MTWNGSCDYQPSCAEKAPHHHLVHPDRPSELLLDPEPHRAPVLVEGMLLRILRGLHAMTVNEPGQADGWLLMRNTSIRLDPDELALVRELIGEQ